MGIKNKKLKILTLFCICVCMLLTGILSVIQPFHREIANAESVTVSPTLKFSDFELLIYSETAMQFGSVITRDKSPSIFHPPSRVIWAYSDSSR